MPLDLRTEFAKRVAFPLKTLVKREPARKALQELNESQWFDTDRLHRLRTGNLRHLLISVGASVPFYREEFRRLGIRPEVDDPWSVHRTLPTLDKNAYRSIGPALRCESPRRAPLVGHTSGTTGERLEVRLDALAGTYGYLAGVRGRQWWGIEPGDPEFKIWGTGRETARTWRESISGVLTVVKEAAMGVTLVAPFFQAEEDLQRAADRLLRRKPKLVFGYANSIYLLAAHLLQKGLAVGPGWPRAVVYTAEMLSEAQRTTVETGFGAPVVAEYGSCEAGVMAYGCPQGSLHTADDILILETLDGEVPAKDGQSAEIVVTHLMATDYPLIRYRQGDLARLSGGSCSCGRGLGVMRSLVGRKNDVLTAPSGGIIDFIIFDKLMKDQPALRRFKVVERAQGDLLLFYELYPRERWADADRLRLVGQSRALLPSDVHVTPCAVESLPQEISGKFRIIVPQKDAAQFLQRLPGDWRSGIGEVS